MRDLSFGHYVAAAVPVMAAAYGIYEWKGHAHSGDAGPKTAAVMTPAQYKRESVEGGGSRRIASAMGEHGGARRIRQAEAEADVDEEDAQDVDAGTATAANSGTDDRSPRSPASDNKPSPALEGAANDALASGADCAQIEYRGEGPEATKITKAEWGAVMDQFHASKRELLGWLEKHRHDLSASAAQAMERQVRDLKIQRPPASDEPDLAWRGIGVYGQNSDGEPIVKLGGGFVALTARHPARARFEMARLLAQAWAPCELSRVSALDTTWSPLLKCLGYNESQNCGSGTYSESGWAVSTTVAASLWPPGCQIPAFKVPELAKCMSNVPFGKVASNEPEPAPPQITTAAPAREISSVTVHSAVPGTAGTEAASEGSHK
jgi:hypothetical protein